MMRTCAIAPLPNLVARISGLALKSECLHYDGMAQPENTGGQGYLVSALATSPEPGRRR